MNRDKIISLQNFTKCVLEFIDFWLNAIAHCCLLLSRPDNIVFGIEQWVCQLKEDNNKIIFYSLQELKFL